MTFKPALAAFLLFFFAAIQSSFASEPVALQCDGVDDTAAVNQAVSEAHASRAPILLPPNECRYSDTIVLTKMIPVLGHSRGVSRLAYCGPGDAIRVEPSATVVVDKRRHLMRDFEVVPCVLDGGDNGIEVRLAPGAFYADSQIERVTIGSFGNEGLRLDNSVGNMDGFFNISVSDCFIFNGVKAILIGDSVVFRGNVVHGRNRVDVTAVPNARLFQFIGGQITTRDGFMHMENVFGARIERVWFEHPSYLGHPKTGLTAIVFRNGGDNHLIGNMIGLGYTVDGTFVPYTHGVGLVNADDTKVLLNTFLNGGSAAHIYGTSSTTGTLIRDNFFNGYPPVIVLQGS